MPKTHDGDSHLPGVCVVSPLYHTTMGGLGRQAVLLSEYLAHKGIRLFVIARRMQAVPCRLDPTVKVFRVWAARPYHPILEEKSFPNLITSLTFSMNALLLLWKTRHEYELVHFHGASVPLMICILPLRLLRKRVIAKVASANLGTEAGALKGKYGPVGWILRQLMIKVDLFIATSREILEGLKIDSIPPDRIRQIPNFVDLQIFGPASETAKIKAKTDEGWRGQQVVTFSGRLVPRKGMAVLMDAWSSVQKEYPSSLLLILGEGPQRAEYQKKTTFCGLSSSVRFLGHVTDITRYLHATDIYVLPSFREGFPNALLEAMACGLPVVASRIGGVEDVIRSELNGLFFTPGNANELSRAVIRLLRNPEEAQRLGQEAVRTIQEQYALETVAKRYLVLYRELGPS